MYYDPCQSVQLTYDGSTGNSMGRVASALIGDMSSCGNQSMNERYSYTAGGLITYKGYSMMSQINYGAFGNLPYSYDFGSSYYYDTEGHMTGYGDGSGNTMTYTLDTMGRPTSMTESGSPGKVWAQNVVYGPAGEMKTMQFRTSTGGYYTEARSYNNRVQMTELSASGAGLTGLDLQYNYGTAGSNIGKIASITDALSGEQVTYTYDALQRLIKAETTHNQATYPAAPWWGQSFGYDGFGNLGSKQPTAGHTATSMDLSISPATNHITSSGFAYDANGNMTSIAAAPSNIALSYDVENRAGGQWFDMENRLLYKSGQWYLYGLHGERLGTFTGSATVMNFPGTSVFYVATTQTQTSRNVYFMGRLIQSNGKTVVRDQVGSVRVNEDGEKFEYYPFGEEITLHNPQDREKFGTYTRDAATGLDDANQRTYASVHGVFSSPDRYQASGGAGEPGSWNRYAYVGGDPVNHLDPRGLVTVTSGIDDAPASLCGNDQDEWTINGCQNPCSPFGIDDFRPVACLQGAGGDGGGGGGAGDSNHAPMPRCDIAVATAGKPRDGQNVTGIPDGPSLNQLGAFTAGRGVYVAVQVQANLFGDTNAENWVASQSAQVNGTYQGRAGGPSRPFNLKRLIDDPGNLSTFRGNGHLDWIDAPGIAPIPFSGDLTFSFTSTAENVLTHAICSVNWGFRLSVVAGDWTVLGKW